MSVTSWTQSSGILQRYTPEKQQALYVLHFYTLSVPGSAFVGCSPPQTPPSGAGMWMCWLQEASAEGSGRAAAMASGTRLSQAKCWVLPLDHNNPGQSYSLRGEWLERHVRGRVKLFLFISTVRNPVLEHQPQNSISSLPFVCLSLSSFLRNVLFLVNMRLIGCIIMLPSKADE